MLIRTSLVALLGALALAGPAAAAPPVLVSVGQAGGSAKATWTLPAGGQTWTVEVATSPSVDRDGYFPTASVVDSTVFMDGTTSWTSDVALEPGTYYLHVSAQDVGCATCLPLEWSAVKSFSVPAASSGSDGSGGSTTPSSGGSGGSGGSRDTGDTGTTETPQAPAPESDPAPTSDPAPAAEPPASTARTNARPRVAALTLRLVRRAHVVGTLRACDDRSGRLFLELSARRSGVVRTLTTRLPARRAGCAAYRLSLGAPPGGGRVTVTLRVRDAAGAWSRRALRRVR